jgi:transposase-like protein
MNDIRERCRLAVQVTLQAVLDEELAELVGADRYERAEGRVDARNGSYRRTVGTSLGAAQLEVGRRRTGGSASQAIGRYRRRTAEVDAMITEGYVRGLSTRDMGPVAAALTGEPIGRSTVSRVTKHLDQRIEELRRERIEEPIAYLYLDATFIDARWARSVENVSVLVAYGVKPDGKRHLLGVQLGAAESEDTWAELLRELVERGLHGVHLVIADDHAGLRNAARKLLPDVPLQRCTVHLLRNILARVPAKHRTRLTREASNVLHAKDMAAAKAALASFQTRLERQYPEAVRCLVDGFAAATRYFAFPKAHWRRIRTTNGLERLHGEIKRRTRAVGAFPDRASALRLITTVALQVTAIWSDRKYLDMSLLDLHSTSRQAA